MCVCVCVCVYIYIRDKVYAVATLSFTRLGDHQATQVAR